MKNTVVLVCMKQLRNKQFSYQHFTFILISFKLNGMYHILSSIMLNTAGKYHHYYMFVIK